MSVCSMSTLNRLDKYLKPDYPLRDGCPSNWSWSKYDKSHEVKVQGKGLKTVHFTLIGAMAQLQLGVTPHLNNGRHYWEIRLTQRIFGTSMMFGLCTMETRLHVDSFITCLVRTIRAGDCHIRGYSGIKESGNTTQRPSKRMKPPPSVCYWTWNKVP